jgi:putative membrane-bound dehydrogenase-like protein
MACPLCGVRHLPVLHPSAAYIILALSPRAVIVERRAPGRSQLQSPGNLVMHRIVAFASFVLALWSATLQAAAPAMPQIHDERLKIELFAAEPQIVTPTGIAVDAGGHILAIESHTHFRPNGYQGPSADRIRRFEDTDGDGRADKITTFSEGTTHTMSIAVYHDGSVYVATRREIFRLRDKDGDGVSDERTEIMKLDTKGDYPHNGLSGFAFVFLGNVYFGFGENLGADYKLVGSDGTTLSGGGEGGNVYRCGPNGEKLHRIATGFWNPFHLALDSFGRLFAIDNDPDSRPPCRLVQVVEGGDYGFRFRLGRSGLHPFNSWNGEVPGTLPMVSGTGEAPSGIVAYESDGLPVDYVGALLVTSWGDHRIERHTLIPRGASYSSTMKPLVTGGEDFRPVGITTAPDGSLYVTDWVKRDYNLHGHGRIWHISAKEAAPLVRVRFKELPDTATAIDRRTRVMAARQLLALDDGALKEMAQTIMQRRMNPEYSRATLYPVLQSRGLNSDALCSALIGQDTPARPGPLRAVAPRFTSLKSLIDYNIAKKQTAPAVLAEMLHRMADEPAEAWAHLKRPEVDLTVFDHNDPFLSLAARRAWAANWTDATAEEIAKLPTGSQRLNGLLVMRSLKRPALRRQLPALLKDADADVRFAAIQWVGEERIAEFRGNLAGALTAGPVTRPIFDAYLAALDELDGATHPEAWDTEGEKYIAAMVENEKIPAALRNLALRMLRPTHSIFTAKLFDRLLSTDDAATRREAVRSLRDSTLADRGARLAAIVGDAKLDRQLRADALIGLDSNAADQRKTLVDLARSATDPLVDEARRALAGASLSEDERKSIGSAKLKPSNDLEAFGRLTMPKWAPSRPDVKDLAAWEDIVSEAAPRGGDPAAGERVFFSHVANCSRCHQHSGRGGQVGPDLTLVGSQLSRGRLLDSILNPDKEVAPQFTAYVVRQTDGTTYTGVFRGEDGGRNQKYADADGHIHRVAAEQIEERKPAEKSIMPSHLGDSLTLAELADLLAYLQQSAAKE